MIHPDMLPQAVSCGEEMLAIVNQFNREEKETLIDWASRTFKKWLEHSIDELKEAVAHNKEKLPQFSSFWEFVENKLDVHAGVELLRFAANSIVAGQYESVKPVAV